MGQGLLSAAARHVRRGTVAEVRAALGARARPHGDQTPVRFPGGRGSLFRLGDEGAVRASGNRADAESGRSGLLSGFELCAVPLDAGGRNQQAAAGPVDGVAERRTKFGRLLELAVWSKSG